MTDEAVTSVGTLLLAAAGAASVAVAQTLDGERAVQLLIGGAGALFGAGVAWATLRVMLAHLREEQLRQARELAEVWTQINALRDYDRDHLERHHTA